MKKLEDYLKPTQEKLFAALRKDFSRAHIYLSKENYILVEGAAPVMLVAHLDTVHEDPVKEICATEDGNILMSPQGIGGDDRCGVYAISTAYRKSAVKPWLLFTCNEEVGGIGAGMFCKAYKDGKLPKALSKLKMIIEIDRKGATDAVYYDCANEEFEQYVTSKGFQTEWGSFSDISYVAPTLGVAAVNLSSGYYNAHTQHEYINRAELETTICKVIEMVADAAKPDFPAYEYVETDFLDYWHGARSIRQTKKQTSSVKKSPSTYSSGRERDIEEMGIPAEIWDEEYDALLTVYDAETLEEFVEMDGEWIIHQLYEEEFGGFDFPKDDSEDDDEDDERKVSGYDFPTGW